MPENQNYDLRGSLFQNTYKNYQDPNDRKPDLRGNCTINGQQLRISGWWATPQNGGQQYLQLRFEHPFQQQQNVPPIQQNPAQKPQPQTQQQTNYNQRYGQPAQQARQNPPVSPSPAPQQNNGGYGDLPF